MKGRDEKKKERNCVGGGEGEWGLQGGEWTEWEERGGWLGLYSGEVIGEGAKVSHTYCFFSFFKKG